MRIEEFFQHINIFIVDVLDIILRKIAFFHRNFNF